MKKAIVFGAVTALLAAGCSAHNDYPETPVISTTTPTYRSTSRSTDLYVGPYYSQPGVNGGAPASLPVIASQDRWDENDPIATQVYTALTTSDQVQPQFLRVYAHKGTIWLQGSVASKRDVSKAEHIARQVHGVVKIVDDLRVAG